MRTALNTPRLLRTNTYCANGLFIRWRAGIMKDRAKEMGRISDISSKEHLQTRSFPNIMNSIESSLILYFPQRGPRIWLALKTIATRANPARMLPAVIILKADLKHPVPTPQMTRLISGRSRSARSQPLPPVMQYWQKLRLTASLQCS